MSVICMSECVKRVTRSELFGNFLLLSRVSSSALIVHSVVCMSVILYGRDSFCTVVRGRNLVVRRADDAALVRELPYRISVQYLLVLRKRLRYEYSTVADYAFRWVDRRLPDFVTFAVAILRIEYYNTARRAIMLA